MRVKLSTQGKVGSACLQRQGGAGKGIGIAFLAGNIGDDAPGAIGLWGWNLSASSADLSHE